MKTIGRKANWLVDFVLFAGALITFLLDLAGLPVNQWLGMIVGLLTAYHLLAHWDWAESHTLRLAGRITVQMPILLLMDTGMMIGLFVIVMTGLLISSWLALPLANYAMWKNVHMVASVATLSLVGLRIAMRWRQGFAAVYWHLSNALVDRRRLPQPGGVPVAADRCDLLNLTGQSNRNPA